MSKSDISAGSCQIITHFHLRPATGKTWLHISGDSGVDVLDWCPRVTLYGCGEVPELMKNYPALEQTRMRERNTSSLLYDEESPSRLCNNGKRVIPPGVPDCIESTASRQKLLDPLVDPPNIDCSPHGAHAVIEV